MVEQLILVIGSQGQLALSFKKICPNSTKFLSSQDLNLADTQNIYENLMAYKPSYIFNFAAYNHVDNAEHDEQNILINSSSVKIIAEYCKDKDIPLLHVSTDYVFDGTQGNYLEDDLTNPINEYGKAKLAGESFIQLICKDYVIIRTAWLYSNGENNFLNKIQAQFLDQGNLKGAIDIIGSPTSSDSLAEGILEVFKRLEKKSLKSDIFHFANKGRATKYQFIDAINILLSKKLGQEKKGIVHVKNIDFDLEAPRPYDTSLNVDKFEAEFNFMIPEWETELSKIITEL